MNTFNASLKYFKAQGVKVFEGIEFAYDVTNGYHVCAKKEIPLDAILLQIPAGACLLPKGLDSDSYSDLRKQGCPQVFLTAVYLVEDFSKHLQKKGSILSSHHDFLQSLPRKNNIVYWTDRERQLLKNTVVESSLESIQPDTFFDEVISTWYAKHAQDWAPQALTKDHFLKAVSVVLARAFTNEQFALSTDDTQAYGHHFIPLADMFNHAASESNVSLIFDGNVFSLISTAPITAGQQIYISYGQLGNGQLFENYGFALLPRDEQAHKDDAASVDTDHDEEEMGARITGWNPNNCIHVSKDLVIKTVKASLVERVKSLATEEREMKKGKKKSEKSSPWTKDHEELFQEAVKLLETTNVLGSSGFLLSNQGDKSSDAGKEDNDADNDPASNSTDDVTAKDADSESEGGAAMEDIPSSSFCLSLLPPELLTTVQVLCMILDSESFEMYKKECNGGKYQCLLSLDTMLANTVETWANFEMNRHELEEDEVEDELGDIEKEIEHHIFVWTCIQDILGAKLAAYPTSRGCDHSWWRAYSLVKNGMEPQEAIDNIFGLSPVVEENTGDDQDVGTKRKRNDDPAPTKRAKGDEPEDSNVLDISLLSQLELAANDKKYEACRIVSLGEKELLSALLDDIRTDEELAANWSPEDMDDSDESDSTEEA